MVTVSVMPLVGDRNQIYALQAQQVCVHILYHFSRARDGRYPTMRA